MDSATEAIYLQKIEEFVYDEDKVLTCPWLSKTLDVDIETAKKCLENYVNSQRNTDADALGVWYYVEGCLKDKDGLAIALVAEENLTEKKSAYSSIYTEFIFIVCKSKVVNSRSINLAYDLEPSDKPNVGSIVGSNCVKRTKKASPVKALPKAVDKEQNSSQKSIKKEKSPIKSVPQHKQPSNSSKTLNVTKAKSGGSGIASFFSKCPPKSKTEDTNDKSPEKKKPKLEDEASPTVVESISDEGDEKTDEKIEANTNNKSQRINETTSKSKGKKRNLSKSKKNENAAKRRKRIVIESDSDDDIFGSDKDDAAEDANDSEEEIEIVVAQPVPLPLPNKHKKRKLVEQTFTDAEGFVVTKKEWVYESGEESEEDIQWKRKDKNIKKDAADETKNVLVEKKPKNSTNGDVPEANGKGKGKAKNKKATVTGNQTTLMSFFKRS